MEMKEPQMVILESWKEMQGFLMVMPSTCCNRGQISCGRDQEKLAVPLIIEVLIGTSEP